MIAMLSGSLKTGQSTVSQPQTTVSQTVDLPTLSVAESLTGGLLSNAFVKVSGASKYFQGSITCYNITQKVKHLGVDEENAKACNCVSAQTAREMAVGCCKLFDSDIAIATTGYAEDWSSYDPNVIGQTNITHEQCAYICLYKRSSNEFVEKFIDNKHLDRNVFRQFVVDEAVKMYEVGKAKEIKVGSQNPQNFTVTTKEIRRPPYTQNKFIGHAICKECGSEGFSYPEKNTIQAKNKAIASVKCSHKEE